MFDDDDDDDMHTMGDFICISFTVSFSKVICQITDNVLFSKCLSSDVSLLVMFGNYYSVCFKSFAIKVSQ